MGKNGIWFSFFHLLLLMEFLQVLLFILSLKVLRQISLFSGHFQLKDNPIHFRTWALTSHLKHFKPFPYNFSRLLQEWGEGRNLTLLDRQVAEGEWPPTLAWVSSAYSGGLLLWWHLLVPVS